MLLSQVTPSTRPCTAIVLMLLLPSPSSSVSAQKTRSCLLHLLGAKPICCFVMARLLHCTNAATSFPSRSYCPIPAYPQLKATS
ncbi:hypothetical protein F4779DRAFT_574581 [Xylariaceae sp. FL0662B]|nr:hypothetical protein F4779DRAFT_574581 [Xylariaceae sp. FL0662B]